MRRAALASPSPVRCARCVKLVSRGGLLVPAAHTWIFVFRSVKRTRRIHVPERPPKTTRSRDAFCRRFVQDIAGRRLWALLLNFSGQFRELDVTFGRTALFHRIASGGFGQERPMECKFIVIPE